MSKPQLVLLKVLKRYMTDTEYLALTKELGALENRRGKTFVAIFQKHFNIETWRDKPIIPQDIWLYNYFTLEYKGKLTRTGLMLRYMTNIFKYNDPDFYNNIEAIKNKKTRLPKGVTFEPNPPAEK